MKGRRTNGIGLAIVGAGRVGLFRGEVAARHPAVEWIGIAELNDNRGKLGRGEDRRRLRHHRSPRAAGAAGGDLRDHRVPTSTCTSIPIMCGDRERPADADREAARDDAQANPPACSPRSKRPGSTPWSATPSASAAAGSRQRRNARTGALGDVTLVTSRAFMNRLVAIDNYKRTDKPETISPMVISGTHALDICMWCLDGKKPVEVYARSIDKVLGPLYHGHRRHRRHGHASPTAPCIISTSPGRCR